MTNPGYHCPFEDAQRDHLEHIHENHPCNELLLSYTLRGSPGFGNGK